MLQWLQCVAVCRITLVKHRQFSVGHVRRNMAIRHARQRLCKIREFVEMRGKETRRFDRLCNVL